MTFESSAYAINGAQIGAALARRALYAEARDGGVVKKGDLKVSELSVPGVGVLISAGVGLALNDYQDDPNEVYVVSNPGSHTIPSSEMPAASPSAKSYIVAVVVGDPDFSQSGHPWMGTDDPPAGTEQTFNYVRPTLIEVSAGATTLNVPYPALPLARIDIPADTTTITNSMITDLRKLSQVRQEQHAFVSPQGTWTLSTARYIPAGSTYADWGPQEYLPQIKVPSWARRAILIVNVNGIRYADNSVNIKGGVRAQLGSVVGPVTGFDLEVSSASGAARMNLMAGGEYNVSAIAGQTVGLRVEGYQDTPTSPTNNQRLRLQGGSQMIFDVRFFEE